VKVGGSSALQPSVILRQPLVYFTEENQLQYLAMAHDDYHAMFIVEYLLEYNLEAAQG
jgi:hypothetical protein